MKIRLILAKNGLDGFPVYKTVITEVPWEGCGTELWEVIGGEWLKMCGEEVELHGKADPNA